MALSDPIVAYNAATNLEAHMVCGQLLDADIEAMVIDDVSGASLWVGGVISQFHKPQVWIERADSDRARMVLTEYERRINERNEATETAAAATGLAITVLCEKCGKSAEFPATLQGSVENCPHCNAYVDVTDDATIDDVDELASAEEDGE